MSNDIKKPSTVSSSPKTIYLYYEKCTILFPGNPRPRKVALSLQDIPENACDLPIAIYSLVEEASCLVTKSFQPLPKE